MMSETINVYIDKVKERTNNHHTYSINARNWDTIISSSIIVIAGIQALSMTILTAYKSDTITITILGATFAFVISCVSKIKDSFSFRALSVQHQHASDDFHDLYCHIISSTEYDNNELINKYNILVQKNHLQTVRFCNYLYCCLHNDVPLL